MLSYFEGNERSKWTSDQSLWGKVEQRGVYPGVDVIYRSENGNLRYDFQLDAYAPVDRIRLVIDGADHATIASDGSLLIQVGSSTIRQTAPRVFQGVPARELPAAYVEHQDGSIGFDIRGREQNLTLLIDPTLVYSTYFGASYGEELKGLRASSDSHLYITGVSYLTDFPPAPGGLRIAGSGRTVFVAKITPLGKTLTYLALLNGAGDQEPGGLDIDSTGSAYVTGFTSSANFPTTAGAYDTTLTIGDTFISKLSPDGGTLVYSSFFGGNGCSSLTQGLRVDSSGNAYIAGVTFCSASELPLTSPPLDPAAAIYTL